MENAIQRSLLLRFPKLRMARMSNTNKFVHLITTRRAETTEEPVTDPGLKAEA